MKTRHWKTEDGGWNARSVLECDGSSTLFLGVGGEGGSPQLATARWEHRVLPIMLLLLAQPAFAQTHSLDWSTIDGGGTSTGGVYTVTGTVGQPDTPAA
jgi:hypothetical protein